MVLYRCYCGYENNNKNYMKKHIKNKKSCIPTDEIFPGIDMSLININDLCIEKQRYIKDNNTKYDLELLKIIIERDLCVIKLHEYKSLNRDIEINFICNCGQKHKKFFRRLFEKGAFCKKCIGLKSKEKIKQTNLIKYGVEHVFQSSIIKEKSRQTNLKLRGVEYSLQSFEIKEKIKQTNLIKYGVENPSQNLQVKEKIKKTMFINHGVEHALQSNEIKQKMNNTMLKIYGVENPSQSKELHEKKKQTCLTNYGVEYPAQNAEISEKTMKNGLKFKEFKFPNGTIIKVQGYEPIALQILLNIGYKQEDIITSKNEVPEVWYLDENNKKHRYFCDIYIKTIDKIIEVKSTWTYNFEKEINLLKANACLELGYDFEFWIINRDKSYKIIKIK